MTAPSSGAAPGGRGERPLYTHRADADCKAVVDERKVTADKPGRQRIAVAVAVVLLITAAAGYHVSPWFRGQIVASFSRKPTRFTELFFTCYAMLPRHLGVAAAFSFTITNHEGHLVHYRYNVIGVGPNGSETAVETSVAVGSGRSVVQTVQFVPSQPNRSYTITVRLVDRPEFIHFTATS